MALKPWYEVVTPRKELREGEPLDASAFDVHIDMIKEGKAHPDHQDPERFFERTYLTENLRALSSEVVRRLNGIKGAPNAVFSMATKFGSGKTHALALLFHLAKGGIRAKSWKGADLIFSDAKCEGVPESDVAVFTGQDLDERGGSDGTPLRKTPWGEIAWQLGGEEAFKLMETFDKDGRAPGGDTIGKLLKLSAKPKLILIDELLNYVSRYRESGLSAQLYDFLQNLTEAARAHNNVVVAVSIPASELEMNDEDESDYSRLRQLLNNAGKPVIMSAEEEISEIVRRRLFEWGGLPDDGKKAASAYAGWIQDNKEQIPNWFPADQARETIMSAYPFHPSVFTAFENKWQRLPGFQQTRGVLSLLALWVSKAYQDGCNGAHSDQLISLGTAPLDDLTFRTAVLEQLGENRLEDAVTKDISGKKDSISIRLDEEAVETIKKARLHQKIATSIFFESNCGQFRAEATLPELCLAVSEPALDIGSVETALDALTKKCSFLSVAKNRYFFNITPNLYKIHANRRAGIQHNKIEEKVKAEVQKVFSTRSDLNLVYFPEKSSDIRDRAVLTFIVLSPDMALQEQQKTNKAIEEMTKECGASTRAFKSALVWCVPDNSRNLYEEAGKLLAWEDIRDEADEMKLDDSQKQQIGNNLKKALSDLNEMVWRTYHKVMLLDKQYALKTIDAGLTHSGSADSLLTSLINRLRQDEDISDDISPDFLLSNWPSAFTEWSTKDVKNAFFASPKFPRLLDPDSIRDMIARGVTNKMLAYVGKTSSGKYGPFNFEKSIMAKDVEISDEMYIITADEARRQLDPPKLSRLQISPAPTSIKPNDTHGFLVKGYDQYSQTLSEVGDVIWNADGGSIDSNGLFTAGDVEGRFKITASVGTLSSAVDINISKGDKPKTAEPETTELQREMYKRMSWQGELNPHKWINFYKKVLSKYETADSGLTITLKIDIKPAKGLSKKQVNDAKMSLRGLGMDDEVETE